MSKTAMEQFLEWVENYESNVFTKHTLISKAESLRDTVEREQIIIAAKYIPSADTIENNNKSGTLYYTQTYNQKEDNNE